MINEGDGGDENDDVADDDGDDDNDNSDCAVVMTMMAMVVARVWSIIEATGAETCIVHKSWGAKMCKKLNDSKSKMVNRG